MLISQKAIEKCHYFPYLFTDVDECGSHSRSKRSFWWWLNPISTSTAAYGGKFSPARNLVRSIQRDHILMRGYTIVG